MVPGLGFEGWESECSRLSSLCFIPVSHAIEVSTARAIVKWNFTALKAQPHLLRAYAHSCCCRAGHKVWDQEVVECISKSCESSRSRRKVAAALFVLSE